MVAGFLQRGREAVAKHRRRQHVGVLDEAVPDVGEKGSEACSTLGAARELPRLALCGVGAAWAHCEAPGNTVC